MAAVLLHFHFIFLLSSLRPSFLIMSGAPRDSKNFFFPEAKAAYWQEQKPLPHRRRTSCRDSCYSLLLPCLGVCEQQPLSLKMIDPSQGPGELSVRSGGCARQLRAQGTA